MKLLLAVVALFFLSSGLTLMAQMKQQTPSPHPAIGIYHDASASGFISLYVNLNNSMFLVHPAKKVGDPVVQEEYQWWPKDLNTIFVYEKRFPIGEGFLIGEDSISIDAGSLNFHGKRLTTISR